MSIETIKRTVQLSSVSFTRCDHCEEGVGGTVSRSINHYITAHGYHLLHIGAETNDGPDGAPWHLTVAILGHDNQPAVIPPAEVRTAN